MAVTRWLFTCEHGGNRIPGRWQSHFAGAGKALESHRGWDAGALCVYQVLAPRLADAAFFSTTSRLLVDLNRSTTHRHLFSEFTGHLSDRERALLLATHYTPWRTQVANQVARWRAVGDHVLHISVHSFTPVWQGEKRNADIGLLYDPQRLTERLFCRQWRAALKCAAPDLRVRMNYPYRGNADGFTTWLRRAHHSGYSGIELELNTALVGRDCAPAAAAALASLMALERDAIGRDAPRIR